MNDQLIAPPETESGGSGRVHRIVYPENPRYRRIRALSMLMDQSIVLPTGYRIGLDPLLGLVPGVGDILGALISCYIVYEGARLGLAKRVLLRMLGNIGIETLAGAFPVVGDIFDAAWKGNMRNLRLVEKHYHPAMPERSLRRIAGSMLAVAAVLVMISAAFFYLIGKIILAVLSFVFAVVRP